MKGGLGIILACGLVVVAGAPAPAQPERGGEPEASRYGWLPSLEAGKARARQSGKPLMVVVRCLP
jgi:hypothetical protein